MSDSLHGTPSTPRMQLSTKQLGFLAKALGVVFLAAGVAKLAAPDQTAAVIALRGLPQARLIGLTAGVTEVIGGSLLLLGFWRRAVAAALFVALIPVAWVFHNPFGAGPGGLQLQTLNLAFGAAVLVGLWLIAR